MGLELKRTGPRLKKVWDLQASRELAAEAHTIIHTRTFKQGHGVDDQPHKPYSTRPLTIGLKSDTARRLKPKGGEPVVDGDNRVVAIHYRGGYAQYKRESQRDHASSTPVNLTLSGRLHRSFRAKRITATLIILGLTGESVVYGQAVNRARRWAGVSPADRKLIDAAAARALQGAMKRGSK